MKNMLLKHLLATLVGVAAMQMTAEAQCRPDGLDGGPCCTPAQPNVPVPRTFRQESLQICWKDCDSESVIPCYAEWLLPNANQSPCAVRNMNLRLRDAPGGSVKWRGRFRVQYSRTWQEIDAAGNEIQVWRYLTNGDLRPTALAGPDPCPVPPSAFVHGRVKFTGYIDMARSCPPPGGSYGTPSFAWMLTHACDAIDHQLPAPRGGVFQPDRSYTFVGPAAGFVPFPIATVPVEAGGGAAEAVRRVDISLSPPVCEYEEPVDFQLQPVQEFCLCGPTSAVPQWAVSDLVLGGGCGTTIFSGTPFGPGFVSMAIGTWTDPTVYPGVEGLRWNFGAYQYFDPCVGANRPEAFYGVTTTRGNPAFTIPSVAGTVPAPLPLTFIDQSNALRSGNPAINVPYKRSDHFINLNTP